MNIATIWRKTRRIIGDSTASIIIKEDDIWDWVNEAQLKIVRDTHCLTKVDSGTAADYSTGKVLPVDWIITKRVTCDDQPLRLIDIQDLDSVSINPGSVSDDPSFYYFLEGKINLFPYKSSIKTIKHSYVNLPTEITSSAVALTVPVSYHEDIVRFCIMRAHERNENYSQMERSAAMFDENVGNRKEEATLQDDNFYVVRDDPAEIDFNYVNW